jgi:hypothetical protein
MSKREQSIPLKVKSLVAAECANHSNEQNGVKNYCWMREKSNHGVCVFFSDLESPRCRYFEEAVLPVDKDLKAVFSSEVLNQEIKNAQKRMVRRQCQRCPETFMAKSNSQRFCEKCQKAANRDKSREWDRANRKSQVGQVSIREIEAI